MQLNWKSVLRDFFVVCYCCCCGWMCSLYLTSLTHTLLIRIRKSNKWNLVWAGIRRWGTLSHQILYKMWFVWMCIWKYPKIFYCVYFLFVICAWKMKDCMHVKFSQSFQFKWHWHRMSMYFRHTNIYDFQISKYKLTIARLFFNVAFFMITIMSVFYSLEKTKTHWLECVPCRLDGDWNHTI